MDEEYNSLYDFRFKIKECCRKLSDDAIFDIYCNDDHLVLDHVSDVVGSGGVSNIFLSIFYFDYSIENVKTVNKKSVLRSLHE